MIAGSLLLSSCSLDYCQNQKNAVDHGKQNESQHHVQDLHVLKDGDKHSRNQNQVNENEDCELFFRHSRISANSR